jgi:hypothetical protein
MTNNETAGPFARFDFTLEEAQAADEKLLARSGRHRDGRICACGHPMTRHTVVSGIVYCKPSKMDCPCKRDRPVLETSDTRTFLRKTEGAGPEHALTRGLQAAMAAGHVVEWLIEPQCDRCQTEGPVAPVPVTQRGATVHQATGYDALLCRACREEV